MKARSTILIALLIALPLGLWAQKGRTLAFGAGEKLTYAISYRAALIPNVKVAEVKFATTRDMVDKRVTYHVRANGKVFPGFKWFFDLDDTYETWLDAATLKPIKFSGRLREGDYKFNMDYIYSWPRMEVYTQCRNLRRANASYKTMPLSDNSLDPIALFFNLRNTDMTNFAEGDVTSVRIILEDTIRTIRYKFYGKEAREIGDMGRYSTLKFSCELASPSGESFQDGSEFFMWLSDDRNKIPLYIESPIRVGTVKATITKYEGLKNPLSSKLR